MAKCIHCGHEIVLVPSAAERARKYGGTPAYYTGLFISHSHCEVEARNKSVREAIERQRSLPPDPFRSPPKVI